MMVGAGVITREDMTTMMRQTLDERVYHLLEKCGKVGDHRHTNTYVVGGFVRDILLLRPGVDVDVVVEGDGIEYSTALAEQLKGELKTYSTFGTATVISSDGTRIDVASARKEEYKEPAVLPAVSEGSLKDDMFRRDFTINSMAVSLNTRSFGELIDFFSGAKDLSKGIIRVLHDESFLDDPTRIMRAVRFEVRFGFKIDGKTEELLRQAVSSKMIERLTPERKRYEVELLFSEGKPGQICERLKHLGIVPHFEEGLKCPEARLIERIEDSITEFKKWLKPTPWVLYTIALADTLPFAEAVSFARSLALPKKQVEKLIQVKMAKPEAAKLESGEDIAPSSVHRTLKDLSSETLIYLYSLAKKDIARKRFRAYIEVYRTKKTHLTGDDLKKLGIAEGPVYTTVLSKVLDARIDGNVQSYKDELELAKRIVEGS